MSIPKSTVLTGEQALSAELPLSHVVVLPYSSRLVIEAGSLRTELSWPSEIALHAGAAALKQHNQAKLVVIGEDNYAGLDSTTDLIVQRATAAYGIEQSSILPVYRLSNGKPLSNTYRQIAGAAQGLVTEKSPNVLVVAFDPHLKRVMQAAQGANLLANFVSVEEILSAADIHSYDDMLPAIAGINRSEWIKRPLGHKKGRLFEALYSIGLISPVYLDVDDTLEDGPVLVEMTTKKRHSQLGRKLAAASPDITQ